MAASVAFCGLLPHPPIVVPDVGGTRLGECRTTVRACAELARRLVARRPDRLLLVSPHSPREAQAFGIWAGARLRGDLGRFAAPGACIDLPNDRAMGAELIGRCRDADVATWSIPESPLDHGAVVPLWFLTRAGWRGPTCIVSLPWLADTTRLIAFGEAIAASAGAVAGEIALIASGDMTHRAKPGAPAGYDPRALEFDRALVAHVSASELRAIADIDPELRDVAAEDAAESTTVVAASIGFRARGAEVLGYEHPFGVGYLVAVFDDGSAP